MNQSAIQIRYNPVKSYKTFSQNHPGQGTAVERAWYPYTPEIWKTGTPAGEVKSAVRFGAYIVAVGNFTFTSSPTSNAVTGMTAFTFTDGIDAPLWHLGFDGSNPAVVATDGRYLYVGGDFTGVTWTDATGTSQHTTTILNKAIHGLVRFDYNAQLDLTWNPFPNSTPGINALMYNPARNTIVVAGINLTSMDGNSVPYVNEVTQETGAYTGWPFTPGTFNAPARTIVWDQENQEFYIGGSFTGAAGALNYDYLIRYNAAGNIIPWTPSQGLDGAVYAVYPDTTRIYVGGDFSNYNASARTSLALFDRETGDLQPYVQAIASTGFRRVSAIARLDNMIFVAGAFTNFDTIPCGCVANTYLTTSGVLDFLPNFTATSGQAYINGMIRIEKTFFFFGRFDNPQKNMTLVPYPQFADTNTRYVSKLFGDDTIGNGTMGLPYATINKAKAMLGGAFRRVCILDSETYSEYINWATGNTELWAYFGVQPTIKLVRGATPGTYGARENGRTIFSTGAPGTFLYVDQEIGNDGTAVRGDSTKPWATIQGALSSGSRIAGDTIQINNGTYVEYLNAGAIPVTIQAAPGQIPVLKIVVVNTTHIQTTAYLALYGLTIIDPSGDGLTIAAAIRTSAALDVADCTIIGNNFGILTTSVGTNTSLKNTIIKLSSQRGANLNGPSQVDNCFFNENGNSYSPYGTADVLIYRGQGSQVTNSTFLDTRALNNGINGAGLYISEFDGTASTYTISNLVFKRTAKPFVNEYVQGIYANNGSGTNKIYNIDNCFFDSLTGSAILFHDLSGTAPKGNAAYITNCWARGCSYNVVPANIGIEGTFKFYQQHIVHLTNCASTGSGAAGFFFNAISASGSDSYICTNCASINSGSYGYRSYTASGALIITGCLEKGSGRVATGAQSYYSDHVGGGPENGIILYSCLEQPPMYGTSPILAGDFMQDPGLINAIQGYENVGLNANAAGILTGNAQANENMGLAGAVFQVTAGGNVTIDGLIFDGDMNFHNGLIIADNLLVGCNVHHCTFRNLGPVAARIASGSRVDNCLFENCNGQGLQIVGQDCRVTNTIGQLCLGAFLQNHGTDTRIINNTGYFCEYGQIDGPDVNTGTLKNNIFSENLALDYSGVMAQQNSCVGAISEFAPLPATRNNPLFVSINADAIDLHLQSQNSGYVYQSAAIGIADDGGDAGAYDAIYYPPITAWMLVVFVYNPDTYKRTPKALKVAEGDTYGGLTYSIAMGGVKIQHEFTWEGDNVMPIGQVIDLLNVFNSPSSETQISFDGGFTWVPTRIRKSQEPYYQEMDGLYYSDDGAPTPVRAITFQESV